jgi:hypothetical protein
MFPLTGRNEPDGEAELDLEVSIVDTWKGWSKIFANRVMIKRLSAVQP